MYLKLMLLSALLILGPISKAPAADGTSARAPDTAERETALTWMGSRIKEMGSDLFV